MELFLWQVLGFLAYDSMACVCLRFLWFCFLNVLNLEYVVDTCKNEMSRSMILWL